MAKHKFRKRKERKRLIRAEMLRRNITVREIAAGLRHTSGQAYTVQAVYKGMLSSPKVMAALIAAGVPAKMFGKEPSQSSSFREEDR